MQDLGLLLTQYVSPPKVCPWCRGPQPSLRHAPAPSVVVQPTCLKERPASDRALPEAPLQFRPSAHGAVSNRETCRWVMGPSHRARLRDRRRWGEEKSWRVWRMCLLAFSKQGWDVLVNRGVLRIGTQMACRIESLRYFNSLFEEAKERRIRGPRCHPRPAGGARRTAAARDDGGSSPCARLPHARLSLAQKHCSKHTGGLSPPRGPSRRNFLVFWCRRSEQDRETAFQARSHQPATPARFP